MKLNRYNSVKSNETRATWRGCFHTHSVILSKITYIGPLQYRFLLLSYLEWAQYGNLIVENLTGVKKYSALECYVPLYWSFLFSSIQFSLSACVDLSTVVLSYIVEGAKMKLRQRRSRGLDEGDLLPWALALYLLFCALVVCNIPLLCGEWVHLLNILWGGEMT